MPAMHNLTFFDLDHTLLPVDSDYAWGCFMVEAGMVERDRFEPLREQFYADYLAGCLDMHAYLKEVLAPLARYTRVQLDRWHAQFMQDIIKPAIRPAALQLVHHHQTRGDLCCMITATNHFVTAPIAVAFGIEHLIAPVPVCDANGNYTGEYAGIPSYREGKVTNAYAWLASLQKTWSGFEQIYFYSDSHNDLPLLEHVTHPVATNPDDKLREMAQSRNWRIIDLFKTT